jgi:hypothetical protein
VKNIGKPCAGKPHARFDEGGLVELVRVNLFRHRQTKEAETDKKCLTLMRPALYSTRKCALLIFDDGPPPIGKRHGINALSLTFHPLKKNDSMS